MKQITVVWGVTQQESIPYEMQDQSQPKSLTHSVAVQSVSLMT